MSLPSGAVHTLRLAGLMGWNERVLEVVGDRQTAWRVREAQGDASAADASAADATADATAADARLCAVVCLAV